MTLKNNVDIEKELSIDSDISQQLTEDELEINQSISSSRDIYQTISEGEDIIQSISAKVNLSQRYDVLDYIDDLSGEYLWSDTPSNPLAVGYWRDTVATRNESVWDRYDFSGISVGSPKSEWDSDPLVSDFGPHLGDVTSYGCTLISQHYGLVARHATPISGHYWRGKSGAHYYSPGYALATGNKDGLTVPGENSVDPNQRSADEDSDIGIVRLVNPPPMWDCARYPIAGNVMNWPTGVRLLILRHANRLRVRTIFSINGPEGDPGQQYYRIVHSIPVDSAPVGGESGKPIFVGFEGELVLVGANDSPSVFHWCGSPELWDYQFTDYMMDGHGESPTFKTINLYKA